MNKEHLLYLSLISLCTCKCAGNMPAMQQTDPERKAHASIDGGPVSVRGGGADTLTVEARQEGAGLVYRVANDGNESKWVFLLVPSLVDGRLSFAVDEAYYGQDRDLIVIRKVDTPPAPTRFGVSAERLYSGAILLGPGQSQEGRITIPEIVNVCPGGFDYRPYYCGMDPDNDDIRYKEFEYDLGVEFPIVGRRVAFEVGWMPAVPDPPRAYAWRDPFEWQGQRFVYLLPENDAVGQRFVRTESFVWK